MPLAGKHMRVLLFAPVLLSILACAGFGPPTPMEGLYTVVVSDLDVSDGCSDWGVDGGDEADMDTLDVEIGSDDDVVTFDGTLVCDMDGATFNCRDVQEQSLDGADATLSTTETVTGEWTTSRHFTSDWQINLGCLGPDCPFSGDCAVNWSAVGTL
jgi:hypothetical protein